MTDWPAPDRLALSEFTPAALASAIRAAGFEVELIEHRQPMPTVQAAAEAIGVDEALILKTLVFQDRAGAGVRVIASGADRVDRKRLGRIGGFGKLSLAPGDVVLDITGWPPGGVAPVGSRQAVRTLIDQRMLAFDRVFGGGGTEHTLIGMNPADIVTITSGIVVDLFDHSGT